jgi:hypothetical protein
LPDPAVGFPAVGAGVDTVLVPVTAFDFIARYKPAAATIKNRTVMIVAVVTIKISWCLSE